MDIRLSEIQLECINLLKKIEQLQKDLKGENLMTNGSTKIKNVYSSKKEILKYLETNPKNLLNINYSKNKHDGWRNKCKFIEISEKYVKIIHDGKNKTLLLNKINCIIPSDSDVSLAMKNYKDFHNVNSCNVNDVINSSAGILGWSQYNSGENKEKENDKKNQLDDKFIYEMKNFNIGTSTSSSNKRLKR